MDSNLGIAGLFILPIIFWIGVMLYIRTFTEKVGQLQSTILFCLAFLLLVSIVLLNLVARNDLTLLTLALIETLILAGTLGLKLKKVTAKQ
jgi:hypothetical protein